MKKVIKVKMMIMMIQTKAQLKTKYIVKKKLKKIQNNFIKKL